MKVDPESPWEVVYAPVPGEEVGQSDADYVPCFELNHGSDEIADILLRSGSPVVTFFSGEKQFEIGLNQLIALLERVKVEFDEINKRTT